MKVLTYLLALLVSVGVVAASARMAAAELFSVGSLPATTGGTGMGLVMILVVGLVVWYFFFKKK